MVQFVNCWVLVSVLVAIHSSPCPTSSSNSLEVSCFRLSSLNLISAKGPGLSSMCWVGGAALGKVTDSHEGGSGIPAWSTRLHEVLE